MNSKKIAIVFIIIMVVLSVFLLIYVKKKYKVFTKKDIKLVKDYNTFYRLNVYANTFYSSNDSNLIKNILDDNYKKESKDLDYDIYKNIFHERKSLVFKTESIKYVQYDAYHKVYLIKGFLYENLINNIKVVDENVSLIMVVDYKNFTYSIYPNNTNLLDTVNARKGNKTVKKDELNIMPTVKSVYSKKAVCNNYYYDYILKIQNIPNKAKKHTNNLTTDFEIIKSKLSESYTVKQCTYNEYNKEYHITDNNDVKITIKELNAMNYVVDLDS